MVPTKMRRNLVVTDKLIICGVFSIFDGSIHVLHRMIGKSHIKLRSYKKKITTTIWFLLKLSNLLKTKKLHQARFPITISKSSHTDRTNLFLYSFYQRRKTHKLMNQQSAPV